MKDISAETNNNLAALFLGAASQLNGNAEEVMLDGGRRARESMQKTMGEIANRFKADNTLSGDASLRAVVTALAQVSDVSDLQSVAMAVKEIPIPAYVRQPEAPPAKPQNPFRM